MDKQTNVFQIVLTIIFVIALVVGVALFAGQGIKEKNPALAGSVTIWGSLDYTTFMNSLSVAAPSLGDLKLVYEEFEPDQLYKDFVEALASGEGPDLIIISSDDVIREYKRLLTVAYDNYPESAYMARYIDSARAFMTPNGVAALPLFVDPLVLYYNKDVLTSEFFINPPATWDDVIAMVPKFSKITDAGGVEKSAIALGTSQNIPHAEDILSLFIMQLGNPISTRTSTEYKVVLGDPSSQGTLPAAEALRFFTAFADKGQSAYSWNTSLPNARDMFLAGDLAMYVGYASELYDIRTKNPNLNFDIALVPQVAQSSLKVGYGTLYGFAVPRTAKNPSQAFMVADILTAPASAEHIAQSFLRAPVDRATLAKIPTDPIIKTIYQSAIIARTWYKPDGISAANILHSLIDDMNAGRDQVFSLVDTAQDALQDGIDKYAPPLVEEPISS